VGVSPDPPLGQIGPDGRLCLRLAEDNGSQASAVTQESGRELEEVIADNGAGHEGPAPVAEPDRAETARREAAAREVEELRDANAELRSRLDQVTAHFKAELDAARRAHSELAEAAEDAQARRERMSAELEEAGSE